MDGPPAKLRLDKWLWYARFFKTRSLAAKQINDGQVRVNAERVSKPAFMIAVGDALTFVQGRNVRVVRIAALGTRRGPASEAQALYEDLTPEAEPAAPRVGERPTKKDRRALDAWRDQAED